MDLTNNEKDSSQPNYRRHHFKNSIWLDRHACLEAILFSPWPDQFGKLNLLDLKICCFQILRASYEKRGRCLYFDAAESRWTARLTIAKLFGCHINGVYLAEKRMQKHGVIQFDTKHQKLKKIRIISFTQLFIDWLETMSKVKNINDFPRDTTVCNRGTPADLGNTPECVTGSTPECVTETHSTVHKNQPIENQSKENQNTLSEATPKPELHTTRARVEEASASGGGGLTLDEEIYQNEKTFTQKLPHGGFDREGLDKVTGKVKKIVQMFFCAQGFSDMAWRSEIYRASEHYDWSVNEVLEAIEGFRELCQKFKHQYRRNHMKPTDFWTWLERAKRPKLKLLRAHHHPEMMTDEEADYYRKILGLEEEQC